MKELRQYDINIFGLKFASHNYEFEIDKKFFQLQDDSILQEGSLKVNLVLEKTSTMLVLNFSITGFIELECDRSLELFNYPLEFTERIIYKYGHAYEEVNEELYIIPDSTDIINVFAHIYELITVKVPFKKLHPKFQEDESEYDTLIYSDEYELDDEEYDEEVEESDEEESPEQPLDPRFAALLKLKEQDNNKKKQ